MEHRGDTVNLGEEDIVKETQFVTEDWSASQVHPNTEYFSYGGMRPPQFNNSQDSMCTPLSQIPGVQPNLWPNYGGGIGPGVQPMMQMYGNGFYPSFPTPTFSGMTGGYGSLHHSNFGDSFLRSQMCPTRAPPPNAEWQNMQNVDVALHKLPRRGSVPAPHHRSQEAPFVSGRLAESSRGQWINPCKQFTVTERTEERIGFDVHVKDSCPSMIGKSSKPLVAGRACQPVELQHSVRATSAETLQEPLPSDSVDVDQAVGGSNKGTVQRHCTPSSQGRVDFQGALHDSSKSNTPSYLNHRKALREDEKSYLKEVKLAISEGRVPQVTVAQDKFGNIVRYKSQFLNALKLAAHGIVQDAYIDVNEEQTMNEIMDEVKRQFVLLRPLPIGMVKRYLKNYFKRCRLEYRQFWLKHGDKKKPDGCKQTAWLKLVEYWKSEQGSKECEKNRVNASAQKQKSAEGKGSPNVLCLFMSSSLTGSGDFRSRREVYGYTQVRTMHKCATNNYTGKTDHTVDRQT